MSSSLDRYSGYDDELDLSFSSSKQSINPVARCIQDLVSKALTDPIIKIRTINALETKVIVESKHNAETKKEAIKNLGFALNSGRLSPEAQIRAIETIERILLS